MSSNLENENKALWLILATLSIVPNMLFRAFVLVLMWRWFVMPLNVPTISCPQAIGLSLIVAMFLSKIDNSSTEEMTFADLCARVIFKPLLVSAMALLFGYICTLFM